VRNENPVGPMSDAFLAAKVFYSFLKDLEQGVKIWERKEER